MRENIQQSNKKNNGSRNNQKRLFNSIRDDSKLSPKYTFKGLLISKIVEINVIKSQIIAFNIFKTNDENKIVCSSKNKTFCNLFFIKKTSLEILNGRLFFYSREEFNDFLTINYINMFVELITKFKNPNLPFFSTLNKIQKIPKPLQITPINKNKQSIHKTKYYYLVQKLLKVSVVKKNLLIQGNYINHDFLDRLLNTVDFNNTYGTFGFESKKNFTESKIKKKTLYNINFTSLNNFILQSNTSQNLETSDKISQFDSLKKTNEFSLLNKKRTFPYKIKKDSKKLGQKKLNNGLNLYKNPGRKKKNSGETGLHNKYSKDNMMRKLKNKIIESARRLINLKIKDESKDKSVGEIKKIEGVYNQDLNIKYNFWLYMQPLKTIFQFKLSTKYSRDDGVSNSTTINYILSQDESKFPLSKKLLEMYFHEYYHNIFLGEDNNWSNEYKIFDNTYEIDYALSKIEEITEDDHQTYEKYKNTMLNLAKNYEIFFLKKNPRFSNSHKGGLYETDIKKFINSISNEDYLMYKLQFINAAKNYINLPDESFNKKNIYIGKYIKSEDGYDLNTVKKKDKDKKFKEIKEKELTAIKTEKIEINLNNSQKNFDKSGIFKVIKFKGKNDNIKEEKIFGSDHTSSTNAGINENNDIERQDTEIKDDIEIII